MKKRRSKRKDSGVPHFGNFEYASHFQDAVTFHEVIHKVYTHECLEENGSDVRNEKSTFTEKTVK